MKSKLEKFKEIAINIFKKTLDKNYLFFELDDYVITDKSDQVYKVLIKGPDNKYGLENVITRDIVIGEILVEDQITRTYQIIRMATGAEIKNAYAGYSEREVDRLKLSGIIREKKEENNCEWGFVDFGECTFSVENHFTKGKIYKIKSIQSDWITVYWDDKGKKNGMFINYFKPSTEVEYKNNLIKQAKEKYGDIKNGDRFKAYWFKKGVTRMYSDKNIHNTSWGYCKDSDVLSLDWDVLYVQGIWAEKIENKDDTYSTQRSNTDPTITQEDTNNKTLIRTGNYRWGEIKNHFRVVEECFLDNKGNEYWFEIK